MHEGATLPTVAGLVATRARGHAALRWRSTGACPPEWRSHLARFGGGFFHSPPGLRIAAPAGEPAFLTLESESEVVGVAAGVWRSCRVSRDARHFYAPTLPALSAAVPLEVALPAWKQYLEAHGAAEAIVDSYDAGCEVGSAPGGSALRRHEYVLSLAPGPEALLRHCAETHRRRLRRGDRAGWTLRALQGPEAMAALEAVRTAAGEQWDLARWCADLDAPRGDLWGATVFSAWTGTTLLAAVLVGWANARGYYVAGASTPAGYRESAALWLHWRVITLLAESGFTLYNLGGTSAAAAEAGDAEHGLYRFKRGFGPAISVHRGFVWRFGPAHLALHSIARWLSVPLRDIREPHL